jgi:tRNA dimethylallyltransferase
MSDKAKTLLVICGPTAAGKSDVALRLAQRLKTEIVSADSRQVYREIPIGTAQPNASELALVPHHFVASRSIHEDYDAGKYAREALSLLESLFQKHDTVVMCGGTGLYIKAVCEGLDEVPPSDSEVRAQLTHRLATEGLLRCSINYSS